MKKCSILIFLLCAILAIQLNAQTFKAYLALGTNITEANLTGLGNSQVGTRLGLNVGAGVSGMISRRWETSMELLYSQNGFYANLIQIPTSSINKITLHFIEVPLTFAYRFNIKKNEQEPFYKRSISGGIAYARLFDYKFLATDGRDLSDEVRFKQENVILFNFSATSFFNESFALNGRGTLSTFGEWTISLRLLYYI